MLFKKHTATLNFDEVLRPFLVLSSMHEKLRLAVMGPGSWLCRKSLNAVSHVWVRLFLFLIVRSICLGHFKLGLVRAEMLNYPS